MDEKEAGGGGGGIKRVTKVLAKRVTKTKEVEAVRLTFKREGVIGKGSFGVVQLVRLQRVSPVEGNGEGSSCIKPTRLAMKTVVVKQRESRELGILKQLAHPNIVPLRYFFFSNAKAGPGITLNLLFDAQPTTVYDALEELAGRGDVWSSEEVAQYGSQLAAGVAYLHSLSIAHRDIKPRNLLLRPENSHLQICDLGSACRVGEGTALTAYICSRFYRAPELLLASTSYSTSVDLWSLGCVLAEMALLRPLVAGEDSGDQFAEIVDLLGPPQTDIMEAMGVEDAVATAAMGLVSAGRRSSRGDDRPLLLDRLDEMLGEDYPGLPKVLEQLLRYQPDKRIPASSVSQESFFRDFQTRYLQSS